MPKISVKSSESLTFCTTNIKSLFNGQKSIPDDISVTRRIRTKTVSVLVRMSLNQAHTDKILLKEGTERTKNLAKMQKKNPKLPNEQHTRKVKGDILLPVPINDIRGKIFDFYYVIIDALKEFIFITELGLPVDKVTSFF